MFNSLRYSKILEEAGVARKQAEAHVEILADMMASHFATTQDLKDLEGRVSERFTDLRYEMRSLEYRLVIKLGLVMASMMGLSTAAMALLIKA